VALGYWEDRQKANPSDASALRKLSSIERMAGNYDGALKWDYKRVALANDPKVKVRALVQIGQLQYSRLTKSSLIDDARLQVADSGIAALQEAIALQPNNVSLQSLIATVYQFRSLAQQSGWARSMDIASQRAHLFRRKDLMAAAKAKAAAANPKGAGSKSGAASPPSPAGKATTTSKPAAGKAASETQPSGVSNAGEE